MYELVIVTDVWTVLVMVWVMVEMVSVDVHGGKVVMLVDVTVRLAVKNLVEVFVEGFKVLFVVYLVVVL